MTDPMDLEVSVCWARRQSCPFLRGVDVFRMGICVLMDEELSYP